MRGTSRGVRTGTLKCVSVNWNTASAHESVNLIKTRYGRSRKEGHKFHTAAWNVGKFQSEYLFDDP